MSSVNMLNTNVEDETSEHLKFIKHIYSSRKSTGYIDWINCASTEIDQPYKSKYRIEKIKLIHSSK